MIRMIQCELLKLRKSKFYLAIILASCIYPILLFVGNIGDSKLLDWNQYIFSVETASFMIIIPPVSCLISAYIFSKEFSSGMCQNLFCYPESRTKLFIAKLITIMLLVVSLLIIQIFVTILLGFISPHKLLTMKIMNTHFKLYLYIIFVQCCILPICILITLILKNLIIPLIYGFILSVCNLFISTYFIVVGLKSSVVKNIVYNIPTFYNMPILYSCFKNKNGKAIAIKCNQILPTQSIIICITTFIIVNVICVLYYKNIEAS